MTKANDLDTRLDKDERLLDNDLDNDSSDASSDAQSIAEDFDDAGYDDSAVKALYQTADTIVKNVDNLDFVSAQDAANDMEDYADMLR